MASSIGGNNFFSTHGTTPELAGLTMTDVTRPGVAGKAWQDTGVSAEPFQLRTFGHFINKGLAASAVEDYAATKGSLVTYADDDGTSWLNMVVLAAKPVRPIFRVLNSSDAGIDYFVLEAVWTLEHYWVA